MVRAMLNPCVPPMPYPGGLDKALMSDEWSDSSLMSATNSTSSRIERFVTASRENMANISIGASLKDRKVSVEPHQGVEFVQSISSALSQHRLSAGRR